MAFFDFLRRWFGATENAAPAPADKLQQLNAVAPLKSAMAAAGQAPTQPAQPAERSFVCREAVLNREERIAGYEFSLIRSIQSRLLEKRDLVKRVYDDALLRNLQFSDVNTLLEHRLAFIHLSPTSLDNALIESLPRQNTVLMIAATPEQITDVAALSAPVRRLGELGLKIGWTLRADMPELLPLLGSADFIEIEASAFDGVQLKALFDRLRALRPAPQPPISLVARNVQTHDDFRFCFQCGFDLFLGAFVSSRENWHPPKSEINRVRVLEILNQIRGNAEFDVIANTLKTEPVLTYKLLRYINSAGGGLQREVTAIPQALLVLGRERFYRWLSLLLFDFGTQGYRERVLTEQALARGRLMELLAGQGTLPKSPDHLFMTGMFSLLDVLMNQPLAQVLERISLPEPVRAGLLGDTGPISAALQLARAVESGDAEEIRQAAELCGVDETQVTNASIGVLSWCQQISGTAEPGS